MPKPAIQTRQKALETFANPAAAQGLPDPHGNPGIHLPLPQDRAAGFCHLTLDYIADKLCVELKSLKLYVWSFRDEGHFHEDVANRILDDLVKATRPRFMRLTARFYVRGGIFTNVVAEHRKKGWKPAPRIELADFPPQSNTRG
jgi:7-cyano-7-deazaguanine reductase